MPLPDVIIENGSCVDQANSFVTFAELLAFACLQLDGADLETKLSALDEDGKKRILFAAMEDLKCMDFCGHVMCDLPFPRGGCEYSDVIVPKAIKQAQMMIAINKCHEMAALSSGSGGATGGVVLDSLKIKDNTLKFKNGAMIELDADGCSPKITEVGETVTTSNTDKIDCLLLPYLRGKVRRVRSAKFCT